MARRSTARKKSCVPKLIENAEPSQDWSLDELNNYAQIQYGEILSGEKTLTPVYWRLGAALVYAKKAFRHGKWVQHLKDLGIDKTRAAKARAIFRRFSSIEEVEGLTVADAYAQRQRRQATGESDDGSEQRQSSQRLRHSVRSIGQRTEGLLENAASATSQEALILIPAVRKAIHRLQEFLEHLQKQVDTEDVAASQST